jgi:predicted RNA-binding Zn ribbon-like protein
VPPPKAVILALAPTEPNTGSAACHRSGSLSLSDRRTWASPRTLLALPAGAAADLFAYGDRWLVRNCEGPTCTLWYYDRTKAHQRWWCTMAICGNRAKARAHRARLAGQG